MSGAANPDWHLRRSRLPNGCMTAGIGPAWGLAPWRRGDSLRTAATATRTPQGPSKKDDSDIIDVLAELTEADRQRRLADIVRTRNYSELWSLLKKWSEEELDADVATYVLFQAANLRNTLELETMTDLMVEQAVEQMEAHEEVLNAVLPALERHVSSIPNMTQCTLVSAIAQLKLTNECIFSAVAQECCARGDATGGTVDALLAAAATTSADTVVIVPPPGTEAEPAAARLRPLDEHGVLGIQLMMLSSAYALAGHYDEQLFELIASQVVEYVHVISESILVNILGAFMDVQHYSRELLEEAGLKLACNLSALSGEDAATLMLVYAFFNVKNEAFYSSLLDLVASKHEEVTDPKIVAGLYRAIQMMPEPVPIPEAVRSICSSAMETYGPLQLSVLSPNVPDIKTLSRMEQDEERISNEMLVNTNMGEIVVRRNLYQLLTGTFNKKVQRNVPATPDGWLPIHMAIQESEDIKLAYQVLPADRMCSNCEDRLRGQIQSEVRCMQLAGWIVVIITTPTWQDQMLAAQEMMAEYEGSAEADSGALSEALTQHMSDFLNAKLKAAVTDFKAVQMNDY